jgi:SWI/SNF-related matrix-associated actin-dependent regulator 1 of chromatin subfamily A
MFNCLLSNTQIAMSQYCGSNREGFNILQTSGRKSVRLDGLFNIISYDLVTKLQEDIAQADFKVQLEIYLTSLIY